MLEPAYIDERINAFKTDLSDMSPIDVIRKHVLHGNCVTLTDSAYFELRSEVATKFDVHPNEVFIVGSGKLGFSIAPQKRYRHFTDTSDIDIVIVSRQLFERIWKATHSYWGRGGYWERQDQFKSYLFQGWVRPDKLPYGRSFPLASEWWDFFNSLSSQGKYSVYKIAGALYMDWYFLEAYQVLGASACADQLRAEEDRK